MDSPPAHCRRHFLPWDRALLPQAAAWLAGPWEGDGPLDLSGVLAIVPTRHAGRRLREALAEHAAAFDAAVFPPRVQTPDALLASGADAPEVGSRLESLLAWTDVFGALDFAAVPDVFPVAPASREFGWAWRLAESFFRLQTQLTEAGLALADVAPRLGAEFPEAERWRQLAALEGLQADRLAALGRCEPHAARRTWARNAPLPAGITRIAVLAVPDPLPLALEVLGAWAQALPVDVVVYAPAAEADAFDGWGRPLADGWARRVLALPDFEQRVHLCADPAAQAERAVAIVRSHGDAPDGLIALGVADPEALPLLENNLSRAGWPSYNPEGRLRRSEGLHALLSALAALAREPSFDAVAALMRCPDFLAAWLARAGPGASVARGLAALDGLRARHLPPDLAAAQRSLAPEAAAELRVGLELVDEVHATLTRGDFPAVAVETLRLLFRDRRFDLASAAGAQAADAAAAWREVLREGAAARAQFPAPAPRDWWEIALRFFGESRRAEDKPAGALDLQGWLELLWEDAPHLAVVGLNDGLVPDAVVGDPFLPEALREALGLKTNAARFARDAYLLQAVASWRNGYVNAPASGAAAAGGPVSGRLDLLLARTSATGEPLRPSRLLLRCADAALPARIAFLFRAVETTRPNLPWTRAWRLAPRRAPAPARVAVTGLRAWLACPFRFYLSHVLRMEPVDAAKSELDARDFGTLCHGALEALALAPELCDCTDEQTLREFLLAKFDVHARALFGENLTLPLVVQLESARQRLAKAAACHARERLAGWRTERVEWPFALELAGLSVRGRIDRVERHATTGAWRVLDYKTSDTAAPPHQAHLRPRRAGDERLPEWRRVTLGGRDYVWADLQLPVYLRALAAEGLGGEIAGGYFNLPKAVGETAVAVWRELTPELLAAAHACTEGVAAAIRAGEFWPPAELAPERDGFAPLFHHGAEDSVTWDHDGGLPAGPGHEPRPTGGASR